jgi:hypothetical protein
MLVEDFESHLGLMSRLVAVAQGLVVWAVGHGVDVLGKGFE